MLTTVITKPLLKPHFTIDFFKNRCWKQEFNISFAQPSLKGRSFKWLHSHCLIASLSHTLTASLSHPIHSPSAVVFTIISRTLLLSVVTVEAISYAVNVSTWSSFTLCEGKNTVEPSFCFSLEYMYPTLMPLCNQVIVFEEGKNLHCSWQIHCRNNVVACVHGGWCSRGA